MKRIIAIILTTGGLSFSYSSFARMDLSVNFSGVMQWSQLSETDWVGTINWQRRYTFGIAGGLLIRPIEYFGVGADLNYVDIKSRQTVEGATYVFKSIQIPVYGRIQYKYVYGLGGVYFNWLLNIDAQYEGGVDFPITWSEADLKQFDMGYVIGVGLETPTWKKLGLFAEYRYQDGIKNLALGTNQGILKRKLNMFNFRIGAFWRW